MLNFVTARCTGALTGIRQTVQNARERGATGDQAAKRQIKNTMQLQKIYDIEF